MSKVTVAATQMACSWDREANLARAEKLIREAAGRGANIVLIQELFETPYFCKDHSTRHFDLAFPLEGHSAVLKFQQLARELGVVLPVSVFERANKAFYNSLVMIDADGALLGSYRKSHIPEGQGYHEKFYFSPGDTGFKVFDTRFGKVGAAICWDQWFPETARAMALMGAEILLYPTAIGSEPQDASLDSAPHWQRTMQGHAAANIMPLVASNRIGTEQGEKYTMTFYGSSFIASHTGEKIAEADRSTESVLLATFDLEEVRRYREAWAFSATAAPICITPCCLSMGAPELLPEDFVFVDLETSGANAVRDRITEVGLVRVVNGELVEEWSSLVNPQCRIPPYIENFTGISNEMVAGAPLFSELAPAILDKLRAGIFVAHNARFDYGFLRAEFRRAGIAFGARVLCTVKLSRKIFPQFARHNLDVLIERHGLTCSARHRALGDARVLFDLWRALQRDVGGPRLDAAISSLLSSPKLPPQLPQDLVDEFPDGPGAYRFYGVADTVLYVGRAHGLRAGMLAHFAADASARNTQLAREVTRIEWVETGGPLGAWLQESQWLKQRAPSINRRARPSRPATVTHLEAPGTFAIVALDEVAADDAQLARCYGFFQSEKDAYRAIADIAAAHRLCLKAMGLETGLGSCLAYQTGKCKGACVGQENNVLHGVRARLALAALKIKAWPFPGRIALREAASFVGETEYHVFDAWRYLGTAHTEDELERLAAASLPATFEVETYRILQRHLAKHANVKWLDLSRGMQWTTTSATG